MAKTARSRSNSNTANENATISGDAVTMNSPRRPPTEEEIAMRAYHIYMERGGTEGNPTDDWLRAERELTEGR